MKFIRNILDKVEPNFHKGGKLEKLFPAAFPTLGKWKNGNGKMETWKWKISLRPFPAPSPTPAGRPLNFSSAVSSAAKSPPPPTWPSARFTARPALTHPAPQASF